ncbi:YppG family protein [Neobacillus sp. PS3-12]|uniref:YppG family protein n=1 Tax=Neobacillus sp. PS3-12 TaxID=3070677 RepID=UPI0027E10513|nr:YppG family protein [Neobacillus sp. PS3-12]WML53855.1 YppG family protein [Neobacillus sp. PS3-12]
MYENRKRTQHFNYGNLGQMMQQENNSYGRNYSHPQQYAVPPLHNPDWHSFQPQNPYYPGQYQPLNQGFYPYTNQATYPVQPSMQKDSQFLFQNPLQPQEKVYPYQTTHPPINGFVNPYPKHNIMPKQPGGMNSLMNSFKSQDGSVDFNKMMNTAGQMMNAVTQVTSLVKGLGGMFKV